MYIGLTKRVRLVVGSLWWLPPTKKTCRWCWASCELYERKPSSPGNGTGFVARMAIARLSNAIAVAVINLVVHKAAADIGISYRVVFLNKYPAGGGNVLFLIFFYILVAVIFASPPEEVKESMEWKHSPLNQAQISAHRRSKTRHRGKRIHDCCMFGKALILANCLVGRASGTPQGHRILTLKIARLGQLLYEFVLRPEL